MPCCSISSNWRSANRFDVGGSKLPKSTGSNTACSLCICDAKHQCLVIQPSREGAQGNIRAKTHLKHNKLMEKMTVAAQRIKTSNSTRRTSGFLASYRRISSSSGKAILGGRLPCLGVASGGTLHWIWSVNSALKCHSSPVSTWCIY